MSVQNPNNNLEVTSQPSATQSELRKASSSTSSQSPPMPRPAVAPTEASPFSNFLKNSVKVLGNFFSKKTQLPDAEKPSSVASVSVTASAPTVVHTAPSSTTASASNQEIMEMEKFIDFINEMLQEKEPALNYRDFSKDLYLQAKQNLENNNINAQPHLIKSEVENLIKRAKVIKKMLFGDAKEDPEGIALRGIGEWRGLHQGHEVFYTEVSQRREENEERGCLVIWPSSKEPGQPDKYYISFEGTKEGPFTERELKARYKEIILR